VNRWGGTASIRKDTDGRLGVAARRSVLKMDCQASHQRGIANQGPFMCFTGVAAKAAKWSGVHPGLPYVGDRGIGT